MVVPSFSFHAAHPRCVLARRAGKLPPLRAPGRACGPMGRLPLVIASVATQSMELSVTKAELRDQMRAARREHVNAQPDAVRALLFNHPPRSILRSIPLSAVIGLYHATSFEAPAAGYARFFQENGHTLALPHFASPEAPMRFAMHTDAFAERDLESGPFGLSQPGAAAARFSGACVARRGSAGASPRTLRRNPVAPLSGSPSPMSLCQHSGRGVCRGAPRQRRQTPGDFTDHFCH